MGAAGYGSGIGVASRPHLLLAMARALQCLLQEVPHFRNYFLIASPLQDPACHTFQEVRFLAVTQTGGDVSLAWLDRRPLGGGIQRVQVPSCVRAGDFGLTDSELLIDLAVLRDISAVHVGSMLQQIPLGHRGGGFVPVSTLFHLEGVQELSAWRYAPPLRLAAALGPDEETAADLRAWLSESGGQFRLYTEGCRVRVLSPGSSLTVVTSLSPPTLPHLAGHVQEWLLTHHGPGVLFDCQVAAGDVCLFVYMPSQVPNCFAGAVQFVRMQPMLRLISRGSLHHTPAERLRFLTFETDEANVLFLPHDAEAGAASHRAGQEEEVHPESESPIAGGHGTGVAVAASDPSRDVVEGLEHDDLDEDTGHSLLQLAARTSCRRGSVGWDLPSEVVKPARNSPGPFPPDRPDIRSLPAIVPTPCGRRSVPCHCSSGESAPRREDESFPPRHDQYRAGELVQHGEGESFPPRRVPGCSFTKPFGHDEHRESPSPILDHESFEFAAPSSPAQYGEVKFPIDLRVYLEDHDASVLQDLTACATAAEVIGRLTRGYPPCVLLHDVSGLPLPLWLREQVLSVPVCGLDRLWAPGASTHIYTDGSERADKVGYAIVVTVSAPAHGIAFLGAFALNSRAGNLGEEVFDSQEAETAGVSLALLWILSAPAHVRHTLWFDCNSAGLGADGVWRPPRHAGQARKLSLVARHLTVLGRACGRVFEFKHVQAHAGQLWNELADVCAAAAARGGAEEPILPEGVRELVASKVLPWAWILPDRNDASLPTVWSLAAGCAGEAVSRHMSLQGTFWFRCISLRRRLVRYGLCGREPPTMFAP